MAETIIPPETLRFSLWGFLYIEASVLEAKTLKKHGNQEIQPSQWRALLNQLKLYREFIIKNFKIDCPEDVWGDFETRDANNWEKTSLYFRSQAAECAAAVQNSDDTKKMLLDWYSDKKEQNPVVIDGLNYLASLFGNKLWSVDLDNEHINKKSQAKKKAGWRTIQLICWISAVLVVGLTVWGFLTFNNLRDHSLIRDHSQFISQSPLFAFKEISFDKFIIWGKPDGVDKHFDRLNVFFVKGTAVFSFNLENLQIVTEKTDKVARKLTLKIARSDMLVVDVNIPQDSIYEVYTLPSEPISSTEAGSIAAIAGGAASIVGGLTGSAVGGVAGSLFGPVGKLIGSFTGATAGGGAAYVATSQFVMKTLSGVELDGNSFGDQAIQISVAKRLIALELLGSSSVFSKVDWEDRINKLYEENFIAQITELFKSLGWRTVQFEFI